MKKRKKKNKIFYFLFLMIFFGISTGYASLNVDSKLSTNTRVEETRWDIQYENVNVRAGSITPSNIPTINNDTGTINFQTELQNPGDYYEFTIDIVNKGTIDAMINAISKTTGLSPTQQNYLNYNITYENGQKIKSRDIVKKQSFVRIKARVEYRYDISPSNLPANQDVLNLSFQISYTQNDGKGREVVDNGVMYLNTNGDVNQIGTIVTIGTEKFYTIGPDGDNIKMLAMYNLNVGNECYNANCIPYVNGVTGMQDENMKGFTSGVYVTKGGTEYSNDYQKGTRYSSYTGSLVSGYMKDYKILLERNFGIVISSVRAIDYYEVTGTDKLGCTSESDCVTKYPWLFATSHWGYNAYSDTGVFAIISTGDYGSYSYQEGRIGVRPVVLVNKSYFK